MNHLRKNLLLYLCCFFGLGIALCGCGKPDDLSEATITNATENRLYLYEANGNYGILNAGGEFIIAPQPNELQLICDRYTNEPRYISMRKPIAGEKGEYMVEEEGLGEQVHIYHWDNTFFYDIYDAEGNLLYENLENTNCETMGDYLILHKEGENRLAVINAKTGEETAMDTDWVSFCGNLFVFSWESEHCARVYDRDMQLLKEIPGYVYYYSLEQNGVRYPVMIGENDRMALFDDDFNLLLPAAYAYFEQINGDFVLANNTDYQSVVASLATGELVVPPQENRDIYYYDGDMAFYRLTDQYNNITFSLVDLRDESKTWTAPSIQILKNNAMGDKALGFYIEAANSEAHIINNQGEVVLDLPAQSWVEGVSDNVIIVKHNRAENRPTKLYTWDGEEIPLEKTYYTIKHLYHFSPIPYLAAYYETPQGAIQIDILDEEGHILLEHLQENATGTGLNFFCDGYRVLARIGFSQGMLDMKGNWIYKESIFDSFANEY